MKALWKGVISFGPMTIPVKLYPATEQQEVRYHYLHKTCHTPLDYARRCPRCELEVPWEDMIRGYEHHNHLVVLTEEELKALVPKGKHTLQLVQCADAAEVDPLYFDKVYYLKPDSGGSKAYILLREALARSNKVAVGTVVLREKEHPVLLCPYQEVLVLHTLFYPPEVESWEKLAPSFGPPRKRELKAAEELIEKLSGGFAGAFHGSFPLCPDRVVGAKGEERKRGCEASAPKEVGPFSAQRGCPSKSILFSKESQRVAPGAWQARCLSQENKKSRTCFSAEERS